MIVYRFKSWLIRMRKFLHHRIVSTFSRNTVLFVSGLLGVAHETLLEHAERPTLLILFAAMMGLPAFLSPMMPGDYGFERPRKPKTREEIEEDLKEDLEEVKEDLEKDSDH